MFSLQAMGLGKTIRAAREAKGWTLEKLEQASGVAVGTISAIEMRDSSRSQYFPAIARALGFSMEQLEAARDLTPDELKQQLSTGVYTTNPHPLMKRTVGDATDELKSRLGLDPILAWEHEDDLPPGEFLMVPRLDVHLSAGEGRSNQVEVQLDKGSPRAFHIASIQGQRLKPNKLAAMTAAGESMDPTIHDGDSLLVDTSQVDVVDGKVYALWYDGGERVKRLYRLPGGGLRIKSDNPSFDTIEMPAGYAEHVRVIGRIVLRSGTGGL